MTRDNTGDPMPTSRLERDIEALLFASDAPLPAARISAITGDTPTKDIREAIGALERWYRGSSRSFGIVEVAGGYQLTTLPEYAGIVGNLFRARRKMRLSQPALETLAIVAYKQPLSRVQIEEIRGVNCDGVISTLVERELITITGRGEGVGRPYLYSTTRKFLEYLGLKDFRDLPALEELEKEIERIDLIPAPEAEGAAPEGEENDPADADRGAPRGGGGETETA
ncbi:MAG: SMC-Scp complex subunit ScpB [Candidatus Krumholzibacteriota bacterium]|nr:SMC-Scp complex subunit ScpB [Candidatus Krumholzibacteriota bacterium]